MDIKLNSLELTVVLRSAGPLDEAFQFQVYASTRADELALVPWTGEQKEAFLRMQFEAQRSHYGIHYPQADWYIILQDSLPIGRMIVDRTQNPILLMDIALLPQHRRQGIGSELIKALMAEAAAQKRAVQLHVETFNPAGNLYERLGFIKTGELGIYNEMTWTPEVE